MPPMKANPLVLLPGTLFWVFLVIALVTKNDVVVTLTIVLGVGTFVGFGAAALRRSATERTIKKRVWADGSPTTATVLTSRTNGSLNDHPNVEMTLDLGGREVAVRQVISQIMVSSVKPGEEIAVKVDQQDPSIVVVDEALTPYGY